MSCTMNGRCEHCGEYSDYLSNFGDDEDGYSDGMDLCPTCFQTARYIDPNDPRTVAAWWRREER